MPTAKILPLAALLAALSTPAWAALTYTGTGAYNLGSSSGPGGTVVVPTACGTSQGQDSLAFPGLGSNNVGIHAYACDDDATNFGSRASGENTFFATGTASIVGSLSLNEGQEFTFVINPGEVGAFGSSSFGSDEFQKASLKVRLIVDGTTYLDELWSAQVGAGGLVTPLYQSNGLNQLDYNIVSGTGFHSYGISGRSYTLDLTPGEHNIFYEMVSEASGQVSSTGICTAVLQDGAGRAETFAEVEGPALGQAFTSYCGAGARLGDPWALADEPIARAQAVELPEPMSAGLTLTALLAAIGVRRRTRR